MGVVVLLLGALSLGQLVDSAELHDRPQLQPVWLEAHMRFQHAGDLIVAGDYLRARAALDEVVEQFPPQYQRLAEAVVRQLPSPPQEGERHGADDDPFGGGEPAAGDVDDLFGSFSLDDPTGKLAASPLEREQRSNDLLRLADICRAIEAHAAALTLYQRAWESSGEQGAITRIVQQLWMTCARPEDAAGWIEKIDERDGDYWDVRMQEWPTTWLGAGDFMAKLRLWRELTPLTRLRAIETLRPQADTSDERIAIFEEQLNAFHELGDHRQRDVCLEAAINLAGDRADVCGALLERAAYRIWRHESTNADRIEYFRRIVEEHPTATQFGNALAMVAGDALQRGDVAVAIRQYERLFQWASERPERTDWLRQPNAINLHQPARTLSLAYERQGDLTLALKYARLAQTDYPYRSFCGTGLEEYLQCVRDRVFHLELKIKESPPRSAEFEPVDLEAISD